MAEKTTKPDTGSDAIRVGVSACLVGQPVRFNGGHSQSQLCLRTLKEYFVFEPFCPEVAAGFGTPRPAMRLVGDPNNPRLTFSDDSSADLTPQLISGFEKKLSGFSRLDGYIVMKKSPSCGMARVKVYQENGYPNQQSGPGIFTSALQQAFPYLPIEEEGRLNDPALRENFILRVYAFHNFRKEVALQPSYHNLLEFHKSYKLVLLSQNQSDYRKMGKMLASAYDREIDDLANDYLAQLMSALKKPANRKDHTNVLLHILGYLKRSVPGRARQNIVNIIQKYHDEQIPLVTPATLLKHYVDDFGSSYIKNQRYLNPYPEELGLRNRL